MAEKVKGFATRWGLVWSLIGGAVGLGNIWRFPRMAATNGGGAFVLAWIIFMLVVSIPIIISEAVLGRATRHGPPGAYKDFIGKKYTWMGAFFIAVITFMISYYMVIMGWVLNYSFRSIVGFAGKDTGVLFDSVSNGPQSLIFFYATLLLSVFFISKKVSHGIERINKVVAPGIYIVLIILAIRALTLPGGIAGLNYYFKIEPEMLLNANTWIQALIQSAWSICAGYGVYISVYVYTKAKSDLALNELMHGVGDNLVALIAGFVVIPLVFAMSPTTEAALEISRSGNYGFTFIALTKLFSQMRGGNIVSFFFFCSLFLAALSSCVVFLAALVTPLMDTKMSRKKSALVILIVCGLLGTPSAWNINFLNNQDWVWGIGLSIGMLMICFAIIKHGTGKVRKKYINIPESELYIGKWWEICIKFVAPVAIVIMTIWWLVQSIGWYPDTWWNPFIDFSIMTIVVQLGIVMIFLRLLNNTMADKIKERYIDTVSDGFPEIPDEHTE